MKRSESNKGEKNYKNKYHFYCSDNKDYWKDFTENERTSICRKFRTKNTNIITYHNITITKVVKNGII